MKISDLETVVEIARQRDNLGAMLAKISIDGSIGINSVSNFAFDLDTDDADVLSAITKMLNARLAEVEVELQAQRLQEVVV